MVPEKLLEPTGWAGLPRLLESEGMQDSWVAKTRGTMSGLPVEAEGSQCGLPASVSELLSHCSNAAKKPPPTLARIFSFEHLETLLCQ